MTCGLRSAARPQASAAYTKTFCGNLCAGSDAEIYIELVQGLGETLVGNYPGTALRCVAAKAALPEASGPDAPRADAFSDEAVRCGALKPSPCAPHALWFSLETQL